MPEPQDGAGSGNVFALQLAFLLGTFLERESP